MQKNDLFDHIHALGEYKTPLSILIKQLKYQQQLVAGELLAYLLIKSVLSRYTKQQLSTFDYLLAVPLYPKKMRQRGFNQAQIITDKLHQSLKIPVLVDCITRSKETMAQEGLSISKRKRNLSGAFVYERNESQKIQGSHILVVDDVVTTGATINSLCELLKQQQVNGITVFCISRTALDKEIRTQE